MIQAYVGSDTFESYKKAKTALSLIAEKLNSDVKIIEADEVQNVNEFLQEVEGIGMFNSTTPILAKRLFLNKKLTDYLHTNYNHLNQFEIIIWHEGKLDSKLKITKLLKDNAALINSDIPKESEFLRWISTEAKKQEVKLSEKQIRFIFERVEYSKWMVLSELKKIKSYLNFNNRERISDEDLSNLFGIDVKGDLWKFTDAVGMRNKKEALSEYMKLSTYEDNGQLIISLIHRELKLISQVIYAKQNNINTSSIGINSYVLSKLSEKVKKYTWQEVYRFVKKLYDLDYAIKKGEIDEKLGITLFLYTL